LAQTMKERAILRDLSHRGRNRFGGRRGRDHASDTSTCSGNPPTGITTTGKPAPSAADSGRHAWPRLKDGSLPES
jgi:hypothetical protein